MSLHFYKTAIRFNAEKKYNKRTLFVFALFLTLSFSLTAQAAPGDLDTSFGNGGKVITDLNNSTDSANAVAVQTDGKIIVAGLSGPTVINSPRHFALVRYNSDGTLDNSFGSGGKVVTIIGTFSIISAIAIQTDGKIVAAGYTSSSPNPANFALARYNINGALDETFGNGGTVVTPFGSVSNSGSQATSVAIQADGKIVAAGNTGVIGTNTSFFALARYNTNGSLDSSFGDGGKVTTSFGNAFNSATAAVIQSDGKIVVIGITNSSVTFWDYAVARYNLDGSLDASFGTSGKVTTHITLNDIASDAVIQRDGKIVVVGDVNNQRAFGLVRYNLDGTLDEAFGNSGKVTTDLAGGTGDAVLIQPDDKIVVAGYSYPTPQHPDFTLARYNINGSLDTSFGTNGIVLTAVKNNAFDSIRDIALQPDGKIVAAGGSSQNENDLDFAVVRYLNDTFVTATRRTLFDFDGDGKADQAVFRSGTWYLLQSQNGFAGVQFGAPTDRITPADFDGDGRTDIAVFRDGVWYWLNSSNGNFNAVQFGIAGDVPVPADYTGDGCAELAVYRGGIWYVLNLTNNQFQAAQFGIASDKPVAADYDGDGKMDFAVVRKAGGSSLWYILGTSRGFYGLQFGVDSDKPVPADYDGDGKTDIAVYRGGFWYVLGSTQNFYAVHFGVSSDVPVAADYDGDGEADIAVFRDGVWYMLHSQRGFGAVQFGNPADYPVQNAFVR